MARKTKEFDIFGMHYRTLEYSAVRGMEIFSVQREFHPFDLLEGTEAFDPIADVWVPLRSRAAINGLVIDRAYVIPPRAVLASLMDTVQDLNFSFAASWKSVKVPARFRDGGSSVASVNIPSMFSQLTTVGKVCTMRELEEYYSLHDAFVMFDSMTETSVNEALAQEAAMSKKK